jgi:hypothetical protein
MEDQKKRIINEIVGHIKNLAKDRVVFSEGMIFAYTVRSQDDNDVLELQTDYGTHLDLLVIIDDRSYSLGGDYVASAKDWELFKEESMRCVEILFKLKSATEELWLKGPKRIGGRLFIPSYADEEKIVLIDRTGATFAPFAKREYVDRILNI